MSTPFCSHNFQSICPVSFPTRPYMADHLYWGGEHEMVLPSSYCMLLNFQCLFLSLKNLLVIAAAAGQPQLLFCRKVFHYIILFTPPGTAAGRRSAKAYKENAGRRAGHSPRGGLPAPLCAALCRSGPGHWHCAPPVSYTHLTLPTT